MQRILASLAALALVAGATLPAAPALAGPRGDQESARAEMRAGRNMPTGEIVRRVTRRMGDAEYLTFEYDPSANVYRLKFIENGQVIWVDVDARTADILRISR
jgi:hypothetical protein